MALSAALTQGLPTQAQEAKQAGISIELNAAQTREGHCLLSFLAENQMETGVDQAVFETVLFDTEGQVVQLSLFDFQALPKARARLRQFQVQDVLCENLGRILVNGVEACEGVDTTPEICAANLTTSTRLNIELVG
ncbi:hypothetical protein RC74_11460 [Falsihalocynthiibacter arcticus]|uniref:Tat pathway signal sequence domain protein n=1 Tax=Falsihalocynthiibacter arcticus TaxID=1579316 RepID=A0A126V0E7_9RHOB|nr:hypothetical protein RC74_11460 [Falsihalocynthiibacter arcticus]